MVAPNAQGECLLGQPEEGQRHVRLVLRGRREHQRQRRKVGSGGKVQARVARAALQRVGVHHAAALVPLVHGHPADGLLHPLIQAQLAELVLVRRSLLRLAEGVAHLVDGDGMPQRRVCPVPVFLARPVRIVGQAEDHGIEPRVDLAPFDNVQRLLMHFPADGVSVGPGGGQEKPQRLLACVAAACVMTSYSARVGWYVARQRCRR